LTVTVRELLDAVGQRLALRPVAGERGLGRTIGVPRVQQPGLALAGFLPQLHPDRIQVLGTSEIAYLKTLPAARARTAVEGVAQARVACFVVTNGADPPAVLSEAAGAVDVPVLASTLPTGTCIPIVTTWLQDRLAPSDVVHGDLVEACGLGVLLIGQSGIGKSEAALDLVTRGHRLVADDVVVVRRISPGVLRGRATRDLAHHMEIRGLGIIDVGALFGTLATCDEHDIHLVVELCEWAEDSDRLGLAGATWAALEATLPLVRIPVRPGRSLALLIETAVRDRVLRDRGTHAAAVFVETVDRLAAGKGGRQ
jgi:HPr kinase/phosphorylase